MKSTISNQLKRILEDFVDYAIDEADIAIPRDNVIAIYDHVTRLAEEWAQNSKYADFVDVSQVFDYLLLLYYSENNLKMHILKMFDDEMRLVLERHSYLTLNVLLYAMFKCALENKELLEYLGNY